MDLCADLRAELTAARERIAEAEEIIRQLRAMIVPATWAEYRGLTLTQGERVVLNTLYHAAAGVVSRERIRAVLDVTLNRDDPGAQISTMMCLLRRKLAQLDPEIRITTLYRFGYRLEPEFRERLAARRIPPLEKRHGNAATGRERR